ncbi:Contactin-3 [Trichoplax sp. H2]|nr:Contactin-3 [Trichoplax sp. H2]|eukprot:RDD40632.1 Contactin-3 [Trichoplax sp. H2]
MNRSFIFLMLTSIIATALGLKAPEITVHPIDYVDALAISRTHDEGVIVPCAATGDGTITYAWRHNDQNLQFDNRIKLSGGNLTFSGIVLADAGQYVCLATNAFGTSISREATLQIRFLPFMPGVSEKFYRKINQNARLHCQIPSETSPRPDLIYWTMADNSVIAQSERVALSIYAGDLIFISGWKNNTGTYRCNTIFNVFDPKSSSSSETRNTGGEQYLNFTINAIPAVAPSIIVPPNDTIANLNQKRVILECIAVGYPIPTIIWQKSTGTLPINRYSFEQYGRHLVLKDIAEVDDGVYQCTAISGGSQVTASARLKVHVDPKWITAISDTDQPVESDFNWPCVASGSTVGYRWYMNGQRIVQSTKYILNANGSLTIRSLVRGDTKVYSCLAYNEHSNIVSSGWLNVTVAAPKFVEVPYTQTTLFRGQSSTIRCTVTGGPRPDMTYTKDGGFVDKLLYNKYTVKPNGNLVIHNVVDSDAGEYKCTATNRYGTTDATGTAVVLSATVFTKPLAATFIRRPKNFTISCTVQKADSLNVVLYWQREGKNITTSRATVRTNGLTSTLSYYNSTLSDSGQFACVAATNVPYVGYVANPSLATLTVNDVPNPPFNFTYSELTRSSVLFSWLPGNPNNSPLLRFAIHYRVNNVNSWRIAEDYIPVSATFRRIALSPFNTYRFRIVAVNAVGASQDSTYQIFSTLGDVPYNAPGEFRVSGVTGNSGALDIRFVPLSREEQNDAGINYRLSFRQQGPTQSWSNVNTGTTGTYRLAGLAQNTRYELRLQPFNNAGFGRAATEIITATTGSTAPTAAPKDVTAYLTSITSVKLRWSKIAVAKSARATAVGYRISFWTYDNSVATTRTFGDVAEASITDLRRYMTYNFRINAFTEGGDGPFSPTVSKYIHLPVPDEVTNLVASEPVRSQVVVQWIAPSASNGAITHYKVNYTVLTVEGLPGSYTANTTAGSETLFTFYNMKTGVYRFTVTPQNANGYGVPTTVQFQVNGIGPEQPQNLKATEVTQTTVSFQWEATENPAEGFVVQHKLLASNDPHQNTSSLLSPTVRAFTASDLKASTTYAFHIVAVGGNIISVPSNQVNVTTRSVVAEQKPFYEEIWFIALVSSVGGLLVILILVCFVRSGRKRNTMKSTGRYVTPHEQEKKPDVPPLPADEPEEEVKRPPLPEESHYADDHFRHSDVDMDSLDSMDQYADLPQLSKFNEDGSFIGEYGELKAARSNVDVNSFMGDYSDVRYDGAASYHGNNSYAPTLRSSRPGSPASTINPNNSAFSTFV